ncbi:MAG TPA: carbohydrate porin [Burkholderiales bacterium]|nr:carbohydrate porin [Burkholderiales bacterium]
MLTALRPLLVLYLWAWGSAWAQADTQDERWNAYGQATYIANKHDAFPAAYTNLNGSPNSLLAQKERSWSATATGYLGVKPWQGGEIFFVPEMIAQVAFSGLHGLGGSVQNGELEKTGFSDPIFYRSRLFLRQTWNLGGETERVDSGPMQLAHTVSSRRFVLTAGNLAIIDIFDRNLYAGDIRQQFLSMNFATYTAYDFGADARGYSWGVAGEYFVGNWVFRAGRFLVPNLPNQLQLNHQPFKYYADQLEIERGHKWGGRDGKVQVLVYRNVALMGRFDDAIAAFSADPTKNAANCTEYNYNSANSSAPDLCYVRGKHVKYGLGISLEQSVSNDAGINIRVMKSDGQSEVDAFESVDASAALALLVKGARWHRPQDTIGLGIAQNWISSAHANYLAMGGVDAFVGDGALNKAAERAFEAYYNIGVTKFAWLTLDYQRVANPAYNSDRGPVNIYGFRLHAEF